VTVLGGVDLEAGAEMAAILGSAGSGKSVLLEIAAGLREPDGGRVEAPAASILVPEAPRARDASPQGRIRARLRRSGGPADDLGRILHAYGLWEVRSRSGKELGRSHIVAAALAAAQASGPDLLLVDCCLDVLTPDTCRRVIAELYRMTRQGTCVVFTTRSPEVAQLARRVLILEGGAVLADGSPAELAAGLEADRIEVETDDPQGVRPLLDPWEVQVEETERGLRLTTGHGLERAAKLLRDGYGTVRAVVIRPATLSDAWERLRGGRASR
jgi:ABC-2 type transport system ATP-binding protein